VAGQACRTPGVGRCQAARAMIPVGGDRPLIDDRAAAGGLTAKPAA
jgi:hypothetical protein